MIRLACVTLAAILSVEAARAAPPVKTFCGGPGDQSVLPIGEGPLTLEDLQCFERPAHYREGETALAPSPFGSAFFTLDNRDGLWLGEQKSVPLQRFDAQVVASSPSDFGRPFAWFKDGSAVLAVTQDKMKPLGGWALGPLKPFLAFTDGTSRQLPTLEHPAGPLDEVHWVGHAGLAVVLFGARGGYYRPAHPDPRPTIAMVDALAGKVIQAIPLAELVPEPSRTILDFLAGRIDGRGRMQALIALAPERWLLWRQGEQPRSVPIAIAPGRKLFALSPNGRTVLVMRHLTAMGMICEHNPHCPPPKPMTGPIAELRDIATGKVIWAIPGTAKDFSNDGVPVISADGRHALISIPGGYPGYTVALVAMASGKILQEIPSPGPHMSISGFSDDSRRAWISGSRRLVTYRIGK